jgi:hypothetical protein
VPVDVLSQVFIEEYLASPPCRRPVFRPVIINRTGELDRPLDPASVYCNIVLKYSLESGISAEVNGLCVHSCRQATATPLR